MKLSERIEEHSIEKAKTQQEMADFLGVKIRVYVCINTMKVEGGSQRWII